MQVTTDLELLQKCTTGDADAFAVIVRRHQNLVCSVAYSVPGNFAASEDVGQDTLVAAWQQLPQSEDLTKFRAWVSSIARNKALTVLRQQRNSQSLSDDVVSTAEEPDGIAINHEEETLVWQALQGLPENYREPMVLFIEMNAPLPKWRIRWIFRRTPSNSDYTAVAKCCVPKWPRSWNVLFAVPSQRQRLQWP